jgi:hypothetical protein
VKSTKTILLAIFAIIALAITTNAQSYRLISIQDGTSNVIEINPNTGSTNYLFNVPFAINGFGSYADYNPADGFIYYAFSTNGISNTPVDIYRLDLVNKTVTRVKQIFGITGSDASMTSISFTSTGDLYIYAEQPAFEVGTLYKVNWATGAATALGSTGTPTVTGIAYDSVRDVIWAMDGFDGILMETSPTNAANIIWQSGYSSYFTGVNPKLLPDGNLIFYEGSSFCIFDTATEQVANSVSCPVSWSFSVIPYTPSPHAAQGVAALTNGFLINVSITDGGFGYTNTPLVRFIGGGGSGAEAVAVVSNGVVIAVNVLDAGYGYTNAPVVVIEPPFILNPVLAIAPMSFLSFSNLTVGGTYQLQQSVAWYWTNQLVSFTATNSLYTQMFAGVWESGNIRLALNPVPSQAFATPQIVNGFVVGATVTSGGSGYVTSPAVSIVGGHGTNAGAISHISGGVVTSIAVTNAGYGYTNTPTIQIAPPPAAAVFPTVQPVMRVDSSSLAPYDNYQVQFKPDIMAPWINWDGGLFSPTDVTNSQFLFITNNAGFFRLQYVP